MEHRLGLPDSEIFRLLGVQIHHNVFSEDLLTCLVTQILTQAQRKEKFTINGDGNFPSPIDVASACIISEFQAIQSPNTAILKRYIPGESSEAFQMHRDPEEFQGTIFLCSLSGQAVFKVFSSDMEISAGVLCVPNTVIAAPADILHQVSEPYEEFGVRCFLFFGYSNNV